MRDNRQQSMTDQSLVVLQNLIKQQIDETNRRPSMNSSLGGDSLNNEQPLWDECVTLDVQKDGKVSVRENQTHESFTNPINYASNYSKEPTHANYKKLKKDINQENSTNKA